MRAPVGRIVATELGTLLMTNLYRECVAVAAATGEAVPEPAQQKALEVLTQPDSPLTASMLRDLEAGQRIEAEQIVGDMLHRGRAAGLDVVRLAVAWCHLQAYELGRAERHA